jgi:hypothetical protein
MMKILIIKKIVICILNNILFIGFILGIINTN